MRMEMKFNKISQYYILFIFAIFGIFSYILAGETGGASEVVENVIYQLISILTFSLFFLSWPFTKRLAIKILKRDAPNLYIMFMLRLVILVFISTTLIFIILLYFYVMLGFWS